MTAPIIRPCQCGTIPKFREGQVGSTHWLQLFCGDQPVGAFLAYTKPEDKARMMQAGIDGWNLAG
jgi:hypothetical protein